MKKISVVGLDLAKTSFQVHAADEDGHVIQKKSLRRNQVAEYFSRLPSCVIGMEACGSAHYWARKFEAMGHQTRLMAPQFVKPYVKTNKTDAADAEAICEAMQRPAMRFVTVKTQEQQAILSVHRVRQGFIRARTTTVNNIRGLVAEFGIVLPKGVSNLSALTDELDKWDIPGIFRELMELQLSHLQHLERRIEDLDGQIQRWHRSNEASQRLMAIPGVGILTATAVVATVGNARQFRNSRDMAAWLGLTPRQHSTGGKPKLLGISKRGDVYLRTLMIHGARSALLASTRVGSEQSWQVQLLRRRHQNVAAVALAHKNARTMWAMLANEQIYDPLLRMPLVA